jgi:DNA-directed RNA polymerase II subunit RPB3
MNKAAPKKAAAWSTPPAAPRGGGGGGGAAGGLFTALRRGGAAGERLEFEVAGVDLAVVNALRRAILAEVPTAAFRFEPYAPAANNVVVHANTSTLHNEFVGHRLSLVPVGFDENQLRVFDPASYRFVLRVKNRARGEVRQVTTGDFEVYDRTGARCPADVHERLFPRCPVTGDHVLLLPLRAGAGASGDGEELHATCTATLGVGRQHARWSPVSICFFRNKADPAASAAALRERLAAAASPEEAARLRAQWPTLDAHRHYLLDAHGEPAAFEFVLESISRLRPEYLVFKAFVVLRARLGAIAAGLRELQRHRDSTAAAAEEEAAAAAAAEEAGEPGKVAVAEHPNVHDFWQVTITGEDHTVGNLLQGMLYRRWVRDGGGREVSYVGYFQPHPLEDHIVVKLKCAVADDDVRARLADGVEWVMQELAKLSVAWIEASGLAGAGIVEVNEFLLSKAAVAAGKGKSGNNNNNN